MDFDTLDNTLMIAGSPIQASYLHGAMVGILCTNRHPPESCWERLQEEVPLHHNLFEQLFLDTIKNLNEMEMGLELILPLDDLPLTSRLTALGDWCEGFFQGMKLAELPAGTFVSKPLVSEILEDLSQIKEVSFKQKASEENEKYYFEIVEFIRVAVLLIYAECHEESESKTVCMH